MSYCRWSCDGHRSDVYAYAHVDGTYTIHVATHKDLIPQPSPTLFEWIMDGREAVKHDKGLTERCSHLIRQIEDAWSDNRVLVPLNLPHDGQTFKEEAEEAMFECLKMLSGVGYHVPKHALKPDSAEETK